MIETGEYEQVGGHVTHQSEARIIAASNWDLEAAVEDGRLRQDLYYRIKVFRSICRRSGSGLKTSRRWPGRSRPNISASRFKRPLIEITPEAMAALKAYGWPGNIRELENAIQQAVLDNPNGGPG